MAELDARNGLPAWDPAANASRVVNNPAELESEFRAGKLNLVADHEYPLLSPDGQVLLTPAAEVPDALQHGFRFAGAEDVARKQADTAGGMLRAAADGALNGATFGLGDALQVAAGADELDLKARKEVNAGMRGVGEVGGVALQLFLTRGAGLGAAAETATARAIGTQAAATTLGRMGVTAVGGAVEGAAYGMGTEVSEAVLGDAPLAAESLIASGAHGAVWGGVGGALLGKVLGRRGSADLAERGGSRLSYLRPTAEEINAAAAKQLGEAPPKLYGQRVLDAMDRMGASALEEQGADDLASVFRGSPESKRKFLEFMQTPKHELEAKTRALKEQLESKLGADPRVAESVSKELDVDVVRQQVLEADAELRRMRLNGAEGDDLARAVAAKDEATTLLAEAKAKQGRFAQDNASVEELRQHFGFDTEGRVSEGKVAEFVNSITRPKSDRRVAALRQLAEGDEKLGALVDDLSERQAAANLARDQLGREQLGGMDLELMAGVAGHGVGGFPGALAAREAAGVVTRPLHSAVARYRAAAQVQRVHKYIADRLESFVLKGQSLGRASQLDRKLVPTTQLMLSGSPDERRSALGARMTELAGMDPDTLADALASSTTQLDPTIPDVAGVVRQRLAQANQLLMSVLPQPLNTAGAGGGLVPNTKAALRMIPDRDRRRFAEVDAAIQDPLRLVDQLGSGRVPDPAAVLAVQTIYPALWAKTIQELSEQLSSNPDAVGWRQAMALAVTLGITTHPAFEPKALNLQQAIAKTSGKPPAARPGPVSRSLGRAQDKSLSGATATLNDHLMERGRRAP